MSDMNYRRENIYRVMRIFDVEPEQQVIFRSPAMDHYIEDEHDPYRYLRIDQNVVSGRVSFSFTMYEHTEDLTNAADEALEDSLGAGGWPSDICVAVMIADLETAVFTDIVWNSRAGRTLSMGDWE